MTKIQIDRNTQIETTRQALGHFLSQLDLIQDPVTRNEIITQAQKILRQRGDNAELDSLTNACLVNWEHPLNTGVSG